MATTRFRRILGRAIAGSLGALALTAAADWQKPAANGDRIPDFSEAGYGGPGDALPSTPAVVRIAPSGDSSGAADRAAIQAAIDRVAAMPVGANGLRGAVRLAPGRYTVNAPLRILASGVVLGGDEGRGRAQLAATGSAGPVIVIGNAGRWRPADRPRAIPADYLPVGTLDVPLDSTAGLAVGDLVLVRRPFTAGWIARIGMDRIPAKAEGAVVQWQPGRGMAYLRRIVKIGATGVTLDAPLVEAISREDGATIGKVAIDGGIDHVGIEHLDGDGSARVPQAPLAQPQFVQLDSSFVAIETVADVWIEDLNLRNFSTMVRVGASAHDVTVTGVRGTIDTPPWWMVPPSAFDVRGQRVLVEHGSLKGSRILIASTQANVAGPTVFYDLVGTGPEVSAGPHQRWATGTLWDNVRVTGDILIENRGNHGSGQGWAAANTVIWNSRAEGGSLLQEAPGTHLWAFGLQGAVEPGGVSILSPGKPVEPASLFEEQLATHGHR